MPVLSFRVSDEVVTRLDALPGSRSDSARGLIERALGLKVSSPKPGRPPKKTNVVTPSSDQPKPEPPSDLAEWNDRVLAQAKIFRERPVAPLSPQTARKEAEKVVGPRPDQQAAREALAAFNHPR